MTSSVVDPSTLRAQLAQRMGELYRREVPRFAQLLELVEASNAGTLRERGDERGDDTAYVATVSAQRHGAIRVGSPAELAILARLFALYGMEPVGFYDLVPAGLPVYSTAFRPVTAEGLAASPFRVFCSLLRCELINDATVRETVAAALATRRVVSDRLLALIARAEAAGFDDVDEEEFLSLSVDVFRWSGRARVDRESYASFSACHRLIADVAAFPGPHINHLTPSALDIDAVQAAMVARGMHAKNVIEGPPRRRCPILLRQTAFNAVEEEVAFPAADGSVAVGTHTARFGEVEQRGAALTPAGRDLYDACLARARKLCSPADAARDPALYRDALGDAFGDFPDDWDTLVERELVYCRFVIGDAAASRTADPSWMAQAIEDPLAAVRAGWLRAEAIPYEDFLPVSAAGIFRSNLGESAEDAAAGPDASSQEAFEQALGRAVIDPQALYRAVQAQSLRELLS